MKIETQTQENNKYNYKSHTSICLSAMSEIEATKSANQ